MHTLFLDSEQAEMIVAAAEAADKILDARLQRADPEGIISASAALQKSKMTNLRAQLEMEPVSRWRDMTEDRKALIVKFAEHIANPKDPHEREAAVDGLVQQLMANRPIRKPNTNPDLDRHIART